MPKVTHQYVIQQYAVAADNYRTLTLNLGLWQSEKELFTRYFHPNYALLDVGCGTGRTTFGLHQLGYTHLTGLDLTPQMVEHAQKLNGLFHSSIPFLEGNACQLPFKDQSFDGAIFSFNGLMSIPKAENRLLAAKEIHRVLKPNAYFIFTTHDREGISKYFTFWQQEALRWKRGEIPSEVYEFGDLITESKNEPGKIFIHIPNHEEVQELITASGFECLNTFMRDERFTESTEVLEASGDCRFWVVQKKKSL
ncbi:MAG: class I SAM-dependent methyltransferase [Bacteroidota bacterium]